MTSLGWYLRRIRGSSKVRTYQKATTANQAMGVEGCKTIAVTSGMQMQYAFPDPRDVEIERAIKHFANM